MDRCPVRGLPGAVVLGGAADAMSSLQTPSHYKMLVPSRPSPYRSILAAARRSVPVLRGKVPGVRVESRLPEVAAVASTGVQIGSC
jgi:hypothetical protein